MGMCRLRMPFMALAWLTLVSPGYAGGGEGDRQPSPCVTNSEESSSGRGSRTREKLPDGVAR